MPAHREAAQWQREAAAAAGAHDADANLATPAPTLPHTPPAPTAPQPSPPRLPPPRSAVGTTLSHEVTRRFGQAGLPEGTIHIKLQVGTRIAPALQEDPRS